MDRTAEDGTAQWRSPMVDVSSMELTELAELAASGDDSALARSLHRLAGELSDPGEPIAGFNSAL